MCPNQLSVSFRRHQRGFLLPLALFILVVMGALALTISRTSVQTQNASIQEFMNVQAFYAAESGAQRAMQNLFLATANRQATDQACVAMAINQSFATVNGLKACTAAVTCTCTYQNNTACAPATAANYLQTATVGLTRSFYTLRSVGTCGPNDHFRAVRTLEVGALREQ
jgi:MSHA biogenesis protein MshP